MAASAPASLRIPPSRDWVVRAYEAVPVPPIAVGTAVACGYLLFFALFHNVAGTMRGLTPLAAGPSWSAELWIWETLNALLSAYLLTAHVALRRGTLRDLQGLRPQLACSDEHFEDVVERALSPSVLSLRLGTGLALATGLCIVVLDPGVRSWVEPDPSDPIFLWAIVRNTAISWCVYRVLWADFVATRSFARIGSELTRVDLLDVTPLAAFARKGQRSAFVWVLFSCLVSLYWVGGQAALVNAALLMGILGLVTASFWMPLRGVHQRVSDAKRRELARVNEAIRRARQEREQGSIATTEGPGALADWVAYRQLLDGVREWPVSTPALLRFGLFVTLGLGSWLGGAIVERLLGAVLD